MPKPVHQRSRVFGVEDDPGVSPPAGGREGRGNWGRQVRVLEEWLGDLHGRDGKLERLREVASRLVGRVRVRVCPKRGDSDDVADFTLTWAAGAGNNYIVSPAISALVSLP